jgi:ribosomal protein S12 methylthiotransferase
LTAGRKIALVTFGCAKNLVDSEVMAGYLGQAGYRFVETTEAADIVLLNTCGFLRASKDEADEAIRGALALKAADPARRVVVAGCYTERHRPELEALFPGVDAWIGVQDLDHIVDVVEGRDYRPSGRTFLYSHRSPRAVSTPASWVYVKVSEGCSHRCAFCSIPLIKGEYRSRAPGSIVEEVRAFVARGVREIDLVSQDTTSYGKDEGRPDGLVRLLQKLIDIPELAWVRILYGYPEEITDGLLEILREPKIAAYLDIPFQHSDPVIVRRMRRAMPGRRALKLLDRIRKAVPGVAVRTSLIVGYPGEGRKEFAGLKEFVREARFDHLGVFTYSREEGTPAYDDGDPVADAVKRRRRDAILEIQSGISAEALRAWKGRTADVLIEGPWKEDPKLLIGRTRFQAPEVDGVVFVESAGRTQKDAPAVRKIEITSTGVYDLHGKPAS